MSSRRSPADQYDARSERSRYGYGRPPFRERYQYLDRYNSNETNSRGSTSNSYHSDDGVRFRSNVQYNGDRSYRQNSRRAHDDHHGRYGYNHQDNQYDHDQSYEQTPFQGFNENRDLHFELVVGTSPRINNWKDSGLSRRVIQTLEDNNVTETTKLQSLLLSPMVNGLDVKWEVGDGSLMVYTAVIVNKFLNETGTDRQRRRNEISWPLALVLCSTHQHATSIKDAFDEWNIPEMNVNLVTGRLANAKAEQHLRNCDVLVGTVGRVYNHVAFPRVDLCKLSILVLDQIKEVKFVEPVDGDTSAVQPNHVQNEAENSTDDAHKELRYLLDRRVSGDTTQRWMITNKFDKDLPFVELKSAFGYDSPLEIRSTSNRSDSLAVNSRNRFSNERSVRFRYYVYSSSEEKITKLLNAIECDGDRRCKPTLIFIEGKYPFLVDKINRRRYDVATYDIRESDHDFLPQTEVVVTTDEGTENVNVPSYIEHVVCFDVPTRDTINSFKERFQFLKEDGEVFFTIFFERGDRRMVAQIRDFAESVGQTVPSFLLTFLNNARD